MYAFGGQGPIEAGCLPGWWLHKTKVRTRSKLRRLSQHSHPANVCHHPTPTLLRNSNLLIYCRQRSNITKNTQTRDNLVVLAIASWPDDGEFIPVSKVDTMGDKKPVSWPQLKEGLLARLLENVIAIAIALDLYGEGTTKYILPPGGINTHPYES
ncbi:hypothetical protein ACRALDRAFT_208170 [Sodiomyces alcalophilus JCM 7366]|uniref:uncharacterized protein n=1 Tax=Sodiomyces alcalophilus JCM 7366 TaxID=591952 RepID=UPI0039B3E0F1